VAATWLATVLAVLFCSSGGVRAQGSDSTEIADNLGNVIASEDFCGLHYNQEAIAAYISKHVRQDDMGFAGMLQLMTAGARVQLNQMSPSAKTAHCAQTAIAAE
jgi:hypothetical protein